ncbi:MAG: hypothetical protein KA712_06735 [Myxococcales bacterium]|nr:hypothetical protein [Myxococcales bacterium]
MNALIGLQADNRMLVVFHNKSSNVCEVNDIGSGTAGLAQDLKVEGTNFSPAKSAPSHFHDGIAMGGGVISCTVDGVWKNITANGLLPTNGRTISLFGLGGDDIIVVQPAYSKVSVYGGAGNDRLTTFATDTYLNGGDGNDSLIALSAAVGTEQLIGGNGNDCFDDRSNSFKRIECSSGYDTVSSIMALAGGCEGRLASGAQCTP